jgi:hypothetical protein
MGDVVKFSKNPFISKWLAIDSNSELMKVARMDIARMIRLGKNEQAAVMQVILDSIIEGDRNGTARRPKSISIYRKGVLDDGPEAA